HFGPFAVTLISSTLRANQGFQFGGGIAGQGGATPNRINVIDSTISDNNPPSLGGGFQGGGIWWQVVAFGELNVIRSTLSGNTASQGAGIFAQSTGPSTDILANSTLSGNQGGGLVVVGPQTMSITNSTISGNLGGTGSAIVNAGGGVYLKNTIID